jgi:predicted metalloprotease with PDZ domain
MKRAFLLILFVCVTLTLGHAQTNRMVVRARLIQKGSAPIHLSVDATEAPRKLFHARLTIPASPGPLTLYYPEWIPGEHGPTGPIINLSGLKFSAGGKLIKWERDPVDMYAFHMEVPQGANSVEVALDFLAPTFAGGFTAGASTTSHLAIITWNQLLLYPRGSTSDELMVRADLKLPQGWKYGTALPVVSNKSGKDLEFAPVSLTTLIDSPVLAGEFFRVVPIATSPPVEIDIAADSPTALEINPELDAAFHRFVPEALAVFGAQHYNNYHFLFTLSDYVAHFGLEHHQSNDSRVAERSFVDDALRRLALGVMTHEYVHSWNGKYRRPAGLATPDYQQPMQGELLWVYEGLTQYLGNLLAARSGLWTPEQYRERLAQIAANLDKRPGREWRPLSDTTIAAQLLYNAPPEWDAERRGVDFYDEGWLIWLDADTLIREKTGGQKALDDFCKLFHGGGNTPPLVKPYTLDDVVAALNQVVAYDWRGFFNERVYSINPRAPLGGIERGGWHLVYGAERSQYLQDLEGARNGVEMGYSLGLRLQTDGLVVDVIGNTPAARAGIGPGMKVVSVNGRQWSPATLREEVRAMSSRQGMLELLVNNEGSVIRYALDYHGGERYPRLERDNGKPDLLGQIIAPHANRR